MKETRPQRKIYVWLHLYKVFQLYRQKIRQNCSVLVEVRTWIASAGGTRSRGNRKFWGADRALVFDYGYELHVCTHCENSSSFLCNCALNGVCISRTSFVAVLKHAYPSYPTGGKSEFSFKTTLPDLKVSLSGRRVLPGLPGDSLGVRTGCCGPWYYLF